MSDSSLSLTIVRASLDSFGRTLVERVALLNASTAVLLVAAVAVDRALARRARASWRIALYAPIALRVVLPFDWSLPLLEAPRVGMYLAPLARITAGRTDAPAFSAFSPYALVAVVYLSIALLLATRAILARAKLARAISSTQSVATRTDTPFPIVEHEELGPMVVGLLAPRIVLPARLLAAEAGHALACVLRHETAHIRRRDAWLSAAMQILAVAAWPIVPMAVALARVRQLVELACDEAALAGSDADERRRYGHVLLDMAQSRWAVVAGQTAGELHFGSTLRARIEAIATARPWPRAVQALVLVSTSLAMLLACTSAGPSPMPAAQNGEDHDGAYGDEFETDSTNAAPAAPRAFLGPDGRVTPEAIQTAVRGRFHVFRACYEAGLVREPTLSGTVSIRFVIDTSGTTTEAADEGSTLPDPEVVSCIRNAFRDITFPKGAGTVDVVYPITFSP